MNILKRLLGRYFAPKENNDAFFTKEDLQKLAKKIGDYNLTTTRYFMDNTIKDNFYEP